MDKSYNPNLFESARYSEWEASGFFDPNKAPQKSKNSPPFYILMPPPNVTGVLHQGHALFVSIEDTYARWKRMRGYASLWLPGTDHAGIATQLMVERMLASEGTSRQKVGRSEFLRRTWEWKEKHGGIIQQQLRALGASCDWSRERFTMDEMSNRAVRASFLRFYHEGLIYRGQRIVNWSTGLQTAVSDLEVEAKTVEGALYQIRYPLADGQGELIVATTRPETMWADTAVAVNPDDDRYRAFIGKEVLLPLANRRIPIIADAYVDREFGTGALKVTPGHDHNDWAIGLRHKLPVLSVIERDGLLNELAGDLKGLTVKAAREKTVALLKEQGFLLKQEKHMQEVGHCQRSGVVIEPLVSMQWWLNVKPMAEKALAAARGSENPPLRFYPEYWTKTYFEWLDNIQDWCISRQLWWGHQVPAWHCADCEKITVPKDLAAGDPATCEHCGSKAIQQDEDVLDTWYSSGLWPITTLGWPEATEDLEKFYPHTRFSDQRVPTQLNSLMETGSDILFFWVARMAMMCTHLMNGRLPFEDVYLHSIVRDSKGQKMSKTKGNVVDPMDIIREHGADSLRLTLLALSGGGRSVNFDLKRLEGYKAFLNKLWNACRYVLGQTDQAAEQSSLPELSSSELAALPAEARWILHMRNSTVAEVNRQLEAYRFDLAFQAIYQFTWYEFCDWYLEFAKLQTPSPALQKVLKICILDIIKLLHPMAPFVTEEIYRELMPAHARANSTESFLMIMAFPEIVPQWDAPASVLHEIEALKEIVEGVRNFRTENQIPPRTEILAHLQTTENKLWQTISSRAEKLAKLARVQLSAAPASGPAGRVRTKFFDLVIPLAGLVDTSAEKTRLQTEVDKLAKDIAFIEQRLANKSFTERAKPELVEKERARLNEFKAKQESLINALENL